MLNKKYEHRLHLGHVLSPPLPVIRVMKFLHKPFPPLRSPFSSRSCVYSSLHPWHPDRLRCEEDRSPGLQKGSHIIILHYTIVNERCIRKDPHKPDSQPPRGGRSLHFPSPTWQIMTSEDPYSPEPWAACDRGEAAQFNENII